MIHTALVLGDTVGYNQTSNTSSYNNVVILGLGGSTKNRCYNYSKKLNSNG